MNEFTQTQIDYFTDLLLPFFLQELTPETETAKVSSEENTTENNLLEYLNEQHKQMPVQKPKAKRHNRHAKPVQKPETVETVTPVEPVTPETPEPVETDYFSLFYS